MDKLKVFQLFSLAGLLLGTFLPGEGLGFSICLFYNFTGMPCPTCGLTRSVAHILHGDVVHSFYYHPAGLLAVLVMVLFTMSLFVKNAGTYFLKYEKKIYSIFLFVFFLVILFGIARAVLLFLEPEISKKYFYAFQDRIIVDAVKAFLRDYK